MKKSLLWGWTGNTKLLVRIRQYICLYVHPEKNSWYRYIFRKVFSREICVMLAPVYILMQKISNVNNSIKTDILPCVIKLKILSIASVKKYFKKPNRISQYLMIISSWRHWKWNLCMQYENQKIYHFFRYSIQPERIFHNY